MFIVFFAASRKKTSICSHSSRLAATDPLFFDEEKITPLKGAQLYGYNPKPILGWKNKQTLCHAACVEFVNYMTNKAH